VKSTGKSFLGGAFFLIGLFLVLAQAGGFSQALGAGTSGTATIFKTLQGR
jgi:hypothetical protein